MDSTAVASYTKRGGDKFIGRRLLDCHNPASRDIIQQDHLIGTTYNNDRDSKKQEGKIDRKCY